MWDENKVLEMLKDMPPVLTDENLLEIQKLIDDNKYWNSKELNRDLCGIYAPFCRICDKTVLTPCAVAFVRMKIAEGMRLQMENVSSEIAQPNLPEEVQSEPEEEVVSEEVPQEETTTEEYADENKKIRIGIGYKRH